MQPANSHSADQLNALLQGEMSAVETYGQALNKIEDPEIRHELAEARDCHARRVDVLKVKVAQLGAEPAGSSGAWGAFANAMTTGATVLGDGATIDILEEGEDQGLAQYRLLLEEPDAIVHEVARQLLPRQESTHNMMCSLKHRFH
ncbi:MAG: PA2169 family four-helix-bundle protein [Candidatus Obscuribacterales bacterium]|jgi:demethoxyubiquinone hydroxylase (CLK1/Coq7/Cat5 family)|nr:PA2169 family four-helix-bundle protein [Candidatus Obscuribacterales bacterium]